MDLNLLFISNWKKRIRFFLKGFRCEVVRKNCSPWVRWPKKVKKFGGWNEESGEKQQNNNGWCIRLTVQTFFGFGISLLPSKTINNQRDFWVHFVGLFWRLEEHFASIVIKCPNPKVMISFLLVLVMASYSFYKPYTRLVVSSQV